jgi:hypothetical protein
VLKDLKRFVKRNSKIIYIVGIGIVVVTHIGILAQGLPQEALGGHAALNLFAVLLIVVSRGGK